MHPHSTRDAPLWASRTLPNPPENVNLAGIRYPERHPAPLNCDDLQAVLRLVRAETNAWKPCTRRLLHAHLDDRFGRDGVIRAINWLLDNGAVSPAYMGRHQALVPAVVSVADLRKEVLYRLAGEPAVCVEPYEGPAGGPYWSLVTPTSWFVVLPDSDGSLLGVARAEGDWWDTSIIWRTDHTIADVRRAKVVWQ